MATDKYTQPPVALSPFDGFDIPKDYRFAYEAAMLGGNQMTHTWSLRSDRGGIHIWGRITTPFSHYEAEWIGEVGCHYPSAPEYLSKDHPSQDHCWLLQGPCWHDGTSLYFQERIADMLPHPRDIAPNHMADRHHRLIVSELLSWHRDRFGNPSSHPEVSHG